MVFFVDVTKALLAAVGLALLYSTGLWVYNRFFHPLSRFPGPLLWTISPTPSNFSTLTGYFVRDVHRIHQVYGPVVRIAPNELSFVTEQAQRDIYVRRVVDGYPMAKNPRHFTAAPNGTNSVSSAPKDDHIRQRKALAHAFSEKALSEQEPLIRKYIDLLMVKLESASKRDSGKTGLDVGKYFNWAVFDIFGDLGFGVSFDCLADERYHTWTSLLRFFPKAALMAKSLRDYGILSPILSLLLIPREVISGAKDHWDLCVQKVHQRIQRKTDRKDIMSYILRKDDSKTEAILSVPELEATGYVLIFAGAETTASSLSATVSYLIRYPAKFAKLREEIRGQFSSPEGIRFLSSTATHLPYMHAVIQESLRLAPPVAGHSPRVVPAGGGVIDNEIVPEGAIVGVTTFAAQRYAPNFTFADSFVPERWLNANHPCYTPDLLDPPFVENTFSGDQLGAHQPFAVGARNCIGMNLAMAEMRLILALFVWHFDISSPAGTEPLIWESQKVYNNWWRVPLSVVVSVANPSTV